MPSLQRAGLPLRIGAKAAIDCRACRRLGLAREPVLAAYRVGFQSCRTRFQ
jgi:hypothetical protein